MPPSAPVRPTVDKYYGVAVRDDYRWMEDENSQEYRTWLAGQNNYARALLERIPGRPKILGDIRATTRDAETVTDVRETDTGTVLTRRAPAAPSAKVYWRPRDATEERLLFAPASEGPTPTILDEIVASPDGSLVAVLTSRAGTEERTLRVVRTVDGQVLPDRVERLREAGIVWLPGARAFAYVRYPNANGPDRLARYTNAEVCVHVLGSPTAQDRVVFGGSSLGPGAPDDYPVVVITEGSSTALGLVYHGVLREISVYVKPLSELGKTSNWHRVTSPADEVTEAAVHKSDLYILSFKNADRGRVLRMRTDAPSLATATPVVHESTDVLEQVRPARDGFFALSLRQGVHRLTYIPTAGAPREASLPPDSSVENFHSSGASTVATLSVESFISSPVWMRWDAREASPGRLPFNPPSTAFADVRVERTSAKSADGTEIPITLLLPQNTVRNGKQYVWLLGYGAGGYSLSPQFWSFREAWLKRGGMFALAHIRGGGENGAAWHRAAMKGNKERSIDDFIACADKLITDGYTTSQRMVANGISAGAIVAGGAMTRRPELFRAIVLSFGANNMLRLDTLPVGAENAREFGSTNTKDGFEALLKMDVVQRVRNGTAYPAVLLQAGANDPRLPTWQSGKLAARIQAASTSGNPVALTVAANVGHSGDTTDQLAERYGDAFAFALWQLGHPDFQGR